jgi:hypothetical protein
MLPEVEVYCETMLGPELTQVVRDAFRAMYQFNSTGDDAGYLNIIFSYGNVNVVDIQDMFFDKLNSDLDILLATFTDGITLCGKAHGYDF